jgi:hypothetical protein
MRGVLCLDISHLNLLLVLQYLIKAVLEPLNAPNAAGPKNAAGLARRHALLVVLCCGF